MNADEIERGISPFNAEKAAFEAGRIMLRRIEELSELRVDFAIETTLATRSYASLITKIKKRGYKVTLVYFWLDSVKLAKLRVAERVKSGGHNIPSLIIERRYKRGLQNLRQIFLPLIDDWLLYDNSFSDIILPIAMKSKGKNIEVFDRLKYKRIFKNG